jgi:hypothetical protein
MLEMNNRSHRHLYTFSSEFCLDIFLSMAISSAAAQQRSSQQQCQSETFNKSINPKEITQIDV